MEKYDGDRRETSRLIERFEKFDADHQAIEIGVQSIKYIILQTLGDIEEFKEFIARAKEGLIIHKHKQKFTESEYEFLSWYFFVNRHHRSGGLSAFYESFGSTASGGKAFTPPMPDDYCCRPRLMLHFLRTATEKDSRVNIMYLKYRKYHKDKLVDFFAKMEREWEVADVEQARLI